MEYLAFNGVWNILPIVVYTTVWVSRRRRRRDTPFIKKFIKFQKTNFNFSDFFYFQNITKWCYELHFTCYNLSKKPFEFHCGYHDVVIAHVTKLRKFQNVFFLIFYRTLFDFSLILPKWSNEIQCVYHSVI